MKRTILSKKEQEIYLDSHPNINWMTYIEHGNKSGELLDSCNNQLTQVRGGNYDLQSSCLSAWVSSAFNDELLYIARRYSDNSAPFNIHKSKPVNLFYGLRLTDGGNSFSLQGSVGMEHIIRLLNMVGFSLDVSRTTYYSCYTYILTSLNKEDSALLYKHVDDYKQRTIETDKVYS